MSHPLAELRFYAIQNSEGKWFRRKGYGGYGETWTDVATRARIFSKPGAARSQISWFANHYPEHPVADLVEIIPGEVNILDEEERVKKAQEKRNTYLANAERRNAAYRLKVAEDDLKRATETVKTLKKKTGKK